MKILMQIGLIFLFGLMGQVLEVLLGIGLPASVLALLLMVAALRLGLLKAESLGETASFLSCNMAFFFLPSGVAVMGEFHQVRHVLLPVLVVIVVSLLVTFGVTYGVTVGVQRLMQGRR